MTKKEFTQIIKKFQEVKTEIKRINEVVYSSSLNNSLDTMPIGIDALETLWLDTIEKAVNDDGDWISYWIYELDFGKKAKKGTVQDGDGKNLPIKTISDLYNLIKR